MDRQSGFTLVEVAIVLAAVAILAALVAPPLAEAYSRARTRGAANEFVTAHAMARSLAVRSGRRAELHIDVAGARLWIEVDTAATAGVTDTVGSVKAIQDGKVTMTSDRTVLCFDGRGLPTVEGSCEAPDATVTFTFLGRADTLRFNGLGKLLR